MLALLGMVGRSSGASSGSSHVWGMVDVVGEGDVGVVDGGMASKVGKWVVVSEVLWGMEA